MSGHAASLIQRGDDVAVPFTLAVVAGTPLDLTGAESVTWVLRRTWGVTPVASLVAVVTDAAAGACQVTLAGGLLAEMEAGCLYEALAVVLGGGGARTTFHLGRVELV